MTTAHPPISPVPGPAPAPLPPPSGLLVGNLLGIGSMVTWAAGFPAAEALLDSWQPLALIAARFSVAVSLLMLVWVLHDGLATVLRANWLRGIRVGGIGFGLGAWLLLVAQSLTDPVTVAIIAASMPVAGTALEILFDGRRLTPRFAVGLVASVLGGIIAVGRTTLTQAGGLAVVGPVYLVAHALGLAVAPRGPFDAAQAVNLLLYALASMALGQLLWISAAGRLGIAVASFHLNIAPFYVMLILLALGGGWSWQQAGGAGIVALGVLVAQWRPGQRRRTRVAILPD